MRNIIILLFFVFCSNQMLLSQVFERIGSDVGFEILADNSSVAVADFDGDLDLDVFVVAKRGDINNLKKSYSRLFRNDNGYFIDVTKEAGLFGLFALAASYPLAELILDKL